MPVHDWSDIEAGLFHHFHHSWIEEIQRVLNNRVLPSDYYAMAEQHAAGFGPDVLTLQAEEPEQGTESAPAIVDDEGGVATLPITKPALEVWGVSEMKHYRRKQTRIAVRHVSDDRVVAMIEVVPPGNKNQRSGVESFIQKEAELLDQRIHLLILDVLPPTPRALHGLHALIWEYIEGVEILTPAAPLSLFACETDHTVTAYLQALNVGDTLTDMPLFLQPGGCVNVPLEETYMNAVAVFPRRWRHLLDRGTRNAEPTTTAHNSACLGCRSLGVG